MFTSFKQILSAYKMDQAVLDYMRIGVLSRNGRVLTFTADNTLLAIAVSAPLTKKEKRLKKGESVTVEVRSYNKESKKLLTEDCYTVGYDAGSQLIKNLHFLQGCLTPDYHAGMLIGFNNTENFKI